MNAALSDERRAEMHARVAEWTDWENLPPDVRMLREALAEIDRLRGYGHAKNGERRPFVLTGTEWDGSGQFRSGQVVEAAYSEEWGAWAIADSEYFLHTIDHESYRDWGGDPAPAGN